MKRQTLKVQWFAFLFIELFLDPARYRFTDVSFYNLVYFR